MNQIKQFRKRHNLSQRQLAELLGAGIRTVQRWESGERTPHTMTLELLKRLDTEPMKTCHIWKAGVWSSFLRA